MFSNSFFLFIVNTKKESEKIDITPEIVSKAAEIIEGEGSRNVIVGFESGYQLGNSDRNVILGGEAAYNLKTGHRNIIMFYVSDYQSIGIILTFIR